MHKGIWSRAHGFGKARLRGVTENCHALTSRAPRCLEKLRNIGHVFSHLPVNAQLENFSGARHYGRIPSQSMMSLYIVLTSPSCLAEEVIGSKKNTGMNWPC